MDQGGTFVVEYEIFQRKNGVFFFNEKYDF